MPGICQSQASGRANIWRVFQTAEYWNIADSNAFCGFEKYDTGFQDETDIRPPDPLSYFRLMPDGEIRFILRSAVIFRNHKIR